MQNNNMSKFDIGNLISLIEEGEMTKDQLITAMNQIQFQGFSSSNKKNINENKNNEIQKDQENQENREENPFEYANEFTETILEHGTSIETAPFQNIEMDMIDKPSRNFQSETKSALINEVHKKENLKNKFENTTIAPISSFQTFSNSTRSFKNDFANRMADYQRISEVRKKKIEQMLLMESEKECSFRPKINADPSNCFSDNTAERLYNQIEKKTIMTELKIKQEQENQANFKKQCTFKPKINYNICKPRYMDSYDDIKSLRNTSIFKDAKDNEESKCTFKPKINDYSKTILKANDYFNMNPYERLSQVRSRDEKFIKLSSYNDNLSSAMTFDEKERLLKFQSRQNEFESIKQLHRINILDSIKCSFKPNTNKKVIKKKSNEIGRASCRERVYVLV